MQTAIAVIGGLVITLGMTAINIKLLWDSHQGGVVRRREGKSYWGHPPPHPVELVLSLVVVAFWVALWALIPVLLLLKALGL